MNIIDELTLIGLVPVVKIDNPADAVPLAQALIAGGLPCAEITFRTDAASGALEAIAGQCPGMLLGAGTVLDVATAEKAVKAGARFIISPGYSSDVVAYCLDHGVPVIPGVNNPTGIQQALSQGLETVKFFPAEQSGGAAMLKALAAPFPQMSFMPTGGINGQNLGSYLALPCVRACGGSWMVPPALINAGNWTEITRLTAAAVMAVHDFEFAHLGINSADETECRETARLLNLFGFPFRETDVAIFTDPSFEVMKYPASGTRGHIAIKCRNIERAVKYLERFGFGVRGDTARRDSAGLTFIYLDREIGGFAVHLLRK